MGLASQYKHLHKQARNLQHLRNVWDPASGLNISVSRADRGAVVFSCAEDPSALFDALEGMLMSAIKVTRLQIKQQMTDLADALKGEDD